MVEPTHFHCAYLVWQGRIRLPVCVNHVDSQRLAPEVHPAEMASAFHQAGYNFSLDQLIKLDSYHIQPERMVALKEAGYDVTIDRMIKANSYHVNTADAVRLRKLGYDFSLDDLVTLKSHNASTNFMVDLYDPDYAPFTTDELIAFRQKNIDAATIKKIRTGAQ